jgi:formylglycine-generating enzyme required for sulfatase activity
VTAALLAAVLAMLPAGCSREQSGPAADTGAAGETAETPVAPSVTVSDDQAVSPVPAWKAPEVEITDETAAGLKAQAEAALEAGQLYESADSAIPIYLALRSRSPDDAEVAEGLDKAIEALVEQGDAALDGIDQDPSQLRGAHRIGAVAREVAPDAKPVQAYLDRVEAADQVQRANRLGERALEAGRIGENGKGGAVAQFREALRLHPEDARARQGLAAAESALIRRAETAADDNDYDGAERWLKHAEAVRPDTDDTDTVAHARSRIAALRVARIGDLRDSGIAALARDDGLDEAREHLAELLRIAPSGDPAAAELRERIELATHYGLFRPGQVFTDALRNGGRGPQMVVIPHGAFRMGAADDEADASDAERPTRNIRFDRGLAVARTEVTVGEFRRFVDATEYQPRSTRRGYSTAYDERSGNLVRRGKVGWASDYTGKPAADDLPVVHVSAHDAVAYAEWLSEQTGHTYRLPSEAEFEYALRAGSQARFPWGDGEPPPESGNFTGGEDVSPSGRRWRNAFQGYGDGAWGPAPAGRHAANAYGLHDMAGNVSEWVADCWHDNYRRAPRDGHAWVNPGCRSRVVRGGAWASSPAQTRSAWRLSVDANTTNARVGFRVVREI